MEKEMTQLALVVACLFATLSPTTQPGSSGDVSSGAAMPSCCTASPASLVSIANAEPAAAPKAEPAKTDAATLFAKLKALSGKYQGQAPDGQPLTITYTLTGGGSALVEEAAMHGSMTTVYTLDPTPNGGRVLLTHYCAAGNQPRMACTGLVGNVAQFTFLDATGNLANPHMHNLTLTFKDNGVLHQSWELYIDNKSAMNVEFDLTPGK